jgi:polyisoprenoid-binding protein YceI
MKLSMYLSLSTLLLATPLAAHAAPTKWNLDQSHTDIGFKVRHLMVTNVKGQFNKFTGTLDFDDKDITKSKVSIEIDAASLDTNEAKRDEHLKSADFFDVAKFPKLTFVSTAVKKAAPGKLLVTGNLTIHGVTKSVTLDVNAPDRAIKDPWGNTKRGFEATTKIKREDFGLTWNKALEAGGVLVGSEVEISIEAEFGLEAPKKSS